MKHTAADGPFGALTEAAANYDAGIARALATPPTGYIGFGGTPGTNRPGRWSQYGASFHFEVGIDEWSFDYDLKTRVWRLSMIRTYGNGYFPQGPGCDASGYVITNPDHLRILNNLLRLYPRI